MCLTKGRMVGFTFSFDSPLNVSTAKGLNTLASACETAKMPFEGVRIGVQSYEALVAAIRNREGFEDVLLGMHDLTDVIGLAKKAIRKHRGLVATAAMQEDLRELIVFYARTGAGAVRCMPFNQLKLETKMGMFDKQLSLVIGMEAGMAKRSASPSEMDIAVSASSSSSSSSIVTSLSLVSPQSVSSTGTAVGSEGPHSVVLMEPVSPGTEVVVAAGQPLGRVDLLVACLPDNATIHRWCLRAINMCVSRVRAWV